MFLCDCLCTFSVLLCVFLWCYLDYISANSFCSAFWTDLLRLKTDFSAVIHRFLPLRSYFKNWSQFSGLKFALAVRDLYQCKLFVRKFWKRLCEIAESACLDKLVWDSKLNNLLFDNPFCWYVDACWSVFAPDYSYFWSCCCSEAAFDWLQLITNFVFPLLACLIFGVVCFVGLSKQCWFQELFWWVKSVVRLLNFWRPVVAKLLWWHLLLWKLESVEGCDLGFLVVGENWQYNNCKIVENWKFEIFTFSCAVEMSSLLSFASSKFFFSVGVGSLLFGTACGVSSLSREVTFGFRIEVIAVFE